MTNFRRKFFGKKVGPRKLGLIDSFSWIFKNSFEFLTQFFRLEYLKKSVRGRKSSSK